MSKTEKNCHECGAEISPDALHCSACLLARAVGEGCDASIEQGASTTSSFDRVPVTEDVGEIVRCEMCGLNFILVGRAYPRAGRPLGRQVRMVREHLRGGEFYGLPGGEVFGVARAARRLAGTLSPPAFIST